MFDSNFLFNPQHGFVREKNHQFSLSLMLNFLANPVENETDKHILYLDFTKAFNSVLKEIDLFLNCVITILLTIYYSRSEDFYCIEDW